jgi:glycine dehydrogenase subunit 1
MRYFPHTQADIEAMLQAIGAPSIDSLFTSIPEDLRWKGPLDIPSALDEIALKRHLEELSGQNQVGLSFLGAGCYPHPAPTAVDPLLSRGEFFTAYTPYQPEISQGTLQAVFEFQTMVARLYGMEIANASMYDGSSSVAEGALLALRVTGRKKVLCAKTLLPDWREVLAAHLSVFPDALHDVAYEADSGRLDLASLEGQLSSEVACVVVSYPNSLGVIESLGAIAEKVHAAGALLVVAVPEPISLGILKSPGSLGADVVAGEGQGFGIAPTFGGPWPGLFAAKKSFLRDIPGRLCGETVDADGQRGYVLTLSTREQHIRRARATSNICTNQGLFALAATIFMSLMGKQGLKRLASLNASRATYARKTLAAAGFPQLFSGPVFNEFVVRVEGAQEVARRLAEQGIYPGLPLRNLYPEAPDGLLVCVTETHTTQDIDRLSQALVQARR